MLALLLLECQLFQTKHQNINYITVSIDNLSCCYVNLKMLA